LLALTPLYTAIMILPRLSKSALSAIVLLAVLSIVAVVAISEVVKAAHAGNHGVRITKRVLDPSTSAVLSTVGGLSV